jgi:hypothetical protein
MNRAKAIARAGRMGWAVVAATAAITAGQFALAGNAALASAPVGWIQLAHFSPNTPAVDVYLYSFGNPSAQLVLHHVAYGTVSPFEQIAAGDYTVAMRPAGAPTSSKPVLSTAVDVVAGHAYTVAGMGPESGIRLQVIADELTTPPGKALVRVIQASLRQDSVTVTAGRSRLATNLKFASVTGYRTVAPGTWTVRVAGSSETATASVVLAAGSIHTLVVLDGSGGLTIDDLLEAAGSRVAAIGGAQTGFGGTAARAGASLRPWAAVATAGVIGIAGGMALVSRRRRPALHAR